MEKDPALCNSPVTIMIVDDMESNIRTVGPYLVDEGYEVMSACSGPEALERMASKTPDLILMDLVMPGMDGFTVCERLRLVPEFTDIPVIFLSSAQEPDFIVFALQNGAVDYITKPFRKRELVARVRAHLALKQMRGQLNAMLTEKDRLMSLLAHDLENPLTAISLGLQVLRTKVDHAPDHYQRITRHLKSSVEEMRNLIDTVLLRDSVSKQTIPARKVGVFGHIQASA